MVTLLLVGSHPFPMTLFPLMRLSGHSRNQETKWSSVTHLLISHPASLRIVVAVMISIPSPPGWFVPLFRKNPVCKANRGFFPLFFFHFPFPFFFRRGAP